MQHSIHIARTLREKEAIFAQRYAIYINEQQKAHFSADHERKLLSDEADASATLIYSYGEGALKGSIRLHLGRTVLDFAPHRDQLSTPLLGKAIPSTDIAIVDRLMVQPDKRGSRLATELMIAAYQLAVANGKKVAIMSTEQKYISLYLKLGFRLYGNAIQLPDGQIRYPMVLFGLDRAHLTVTDSPFLAYLPLGMDDGGVHLRRLRQELGHCFVKCLAHSSGSESGCPLQQGFKRGAAFSEARVGAMKQLLNKDGL